MRLPTRASTAMQTTSRIAVCRRGSRSKIMSSMVATRCERLRADSVPVPCRFLHRAESRTCRTNTRSLESAARRLPRLAEEEHAPLRDRTTIDLRRAVRARPLGHVQARCCDVSARLRRPLGRGQPHPRPHRSDDRPRRAGRVSRRRVPAQAPVRDGTCVFSTPHELWSFWTGPVAEAFGIEPTVASGRRAGAGGRR